MSRKRKAIHWIKASTGIEFGPFIEEADAKLTLGALALFREDLTWELIEREE